MASDLEIMEDTLKALEEAYEKANRAFFYLRAVYSESDVERELEICKTRISDGADGLNSAIGRLKWAIELHKGWHKEELAEDEEHGN